MLANRWVDWAAVFEGVSMKHEENDNKKLWQEDLCDLCCSFYARFSEW